MPEEQDLLLRASQMETQALAEIYDTYSPGLYRYAARLLGNSNLAEDCVAEAFARFLDALQKRKGPRDHLQAYLYRIAHNWIVDSFRNYKIQAELDESLPGEDRPEEEAVKRIRQRELRHALHDLTPDQQQVIALKFLEDWSNEEIARAVNKPLGAVKSIQHRALKSLRRFMEASDNHEGSKRIGNPAAEEFGGA